MFIRCSSNDDDDDDEDDDDEDDDDEHYCFIVNPHSWLENPPELKAPPARATKTRQ